MKLYERKIIAIKKALELEKELLNIKKPTLTFKTYHRDLRQVNMALMRATQLDQLSVEKVFAKVLTNFCHQVSLDINTTYKLLKELKNEK